MQKHVKIYLNYFNIGIEDIWKCEVCGKQDHIEKFDIHHINNRIGKDANIIKNLICVCRTCHNKAHASKEYLSKSDYQYLHNKFISITKKL